MDRDHPFADHLGLVVRSAGDGRSQATLLVDGRHINPHGVVHGAVLFALADTGMGRALYTRLAPNQSCATIEIKINFLAPVQGGEIRCDTELLRLGRSVAHLESRLHAGDQLVATASGHFAVFERRG